MRCDDNEPQIIWFYWRNCIKCIRWWWWVMSTNMTNDDGVTAFRFLIFIPFVFIFNADACPIFIHEAIKITCLDWMHWRYSINILMKEMDFTIQFGVFGRCVIRWSNVNMSRMWIHERNVFDAENLHSPRPHHSMWFLVLSCEWNGRVGFINKNTFTEIRFRFAMVKQKILQIIINYSLFENMFDGFVVWYACTAKRKYAHEILNVTLIQITSCHPIIIIIDAGLVVDENKMETHSMNW